MTKYLGVMFDERAKRPVHAYEKTMAGILANVFFFTFLAFFLETFQYSRRNRCVFTIHIGTVLRTVLPRGGC